MAHEILVIGSSGKGKSTSMRNLDPKATYIVNVQGKSLPFKAAGKYKQGENYLQTDDAAVIVTALKQISAGRKEIKFVIIDDFQYVMSNEFMRRVAEKGYNKFNDIAKNSWDIVECVRHLRSDLYVAFLTHADEDIDANGAKSVKAKTIGKMFDKYVTLEGMFSVVLYADALKTADGIKYCFRTQTDGTNTGKSPYGMFSDIYIDNDLKIVFDAIRSYYSDEPELNEPPQKITKETLTLLNDLCKKAGVTPEQHTAMLKQAGDVQFFDDVTESQAKNWINALQNKVNTNVTI